MFSPRPRTRPHMIWLRTTSAHLSTWWMNSIQMVVRIVIITLWANPQVLRSPPGHIFWWTITDDDFWHLNFEWIPFRHLLGPSSSHSGKVYMCSDLLLNISPVNHAADSLCACHHATSLLAPSSKPETSCHNVCRNPLSCRCLWEY